MLTRKEKQILLEKEFKSLNVGLNDPIDQGTFIDFIDYKVIYFQIFKF
jgi:hypothetical protein